MNSQILITGRNSYIGTYLKTYLAGNDSCIIDMISLRNEEWKDVDFGKYDVIFHAAGIAHADMPKRNSSEYNHIKQLYNSVNCDLTIEIAKKAKREGVKHFIFMSSIIVYGDSARVGSKKVISEATEPCPSSFYGESKLQAEEGILSLQTENFHVAVIRSPMVYGKGSKGNYARLSKISRLCPIFPDIDNERSMIHIDNLCELVRLLISESAYGIYCPQNREYVKTARLVELVAKLYGMRIYRVKTFNILIRLLGKHFEFINKIFGNLVYDKELSNYHNYDYCIRNFEESVRLTEGK